MKYVENFDNGPGGWFTWISNAGGPKSLEMKDSCAISRSPWWIDYNHAPPGAGYLHLLFMLNTNAPHGEHFREVAGVNRYVEGKYPINFLNATLKLRLKGELEERGAKLALLCQCVQNGICSGWIFTGQPFHVTSDWSEQTVTITADPSQWTSLGTRHDRAETYGEIPLGTVLTNVNTNIMLIMYPLDVAPMGPIDGEPHILRPEKDYPVWRSRLPEGYVMLDQVEIQFANQQK